MNTNKQVIVNNFEHAPWRKRLLVCWWIVRYGGFVNFRDIDSGRVQTLPKTEAVMETVKTIAGKLPQFPQFPPPRGARA